MLSQWVTAVLLVLAFGLFSYNFWKLLQIILAGASRDVWNAYHLRLKAVIDQVVLHKKLFRQGVPGLIHFLIFWGFVILSAGTLEWMYMGLTGGGKFDFLGRTGYGLFLLSQDWFNSFVLAAILVAFWRRLVVKPQRMRDNSSKSRADAYFILALIGGLVATSLLCHAIEIQNYGDKALPSFQVFSSLLAGVLPELTTGGWIYQASWWLHLLIVLVFLNYLPFSKHLHVILAFPNVFFSKVKARGELSTPDLEDESIEEFGAERVENLPWTSLLDAFACTECGRCNEFCPTASTGKALKPKTLMIDLRAAATRRKSLYQQNIEGNAALAALQEETLVPNTFSDQFVWDCTTCGACVEACPVMIDHVDAIVEMRRALVLNRGSNPDEATNVFRNFETSSNPWGLSEESRQDWLVQQGVPLFENSEDFDYLYYIGCAGSFDERNRKVVDSVIKLLKKAEVKFGILGKEEKCNGETARRMGNEWLAQQMMQTTVELLNGKAVKKVITSCPHCFNTLKNEYPAFGGQYEVIHHSEVLDSLIQEGRIQPKKSVSDSLTYHDSCYIGRYNDIYDQPRRALQSVSEKKLIEMPRSRDKGFCCGAGGGRMWLEETTGTRINANRADEIIQSGAKRVGVGCPFCMTMITDGLKSKEREDIVVQDLAEVIAEAVD